MNFSLSFEEILAISSSSDFKKNGEVADVSQIDSLENAKVGSLSFLGNRRYKKQVFDSDASILLLPKNFEIEPKEGQAAVFVENPSLVLAKVCQKISEEISPKIQSKIHPSAVVDDSAFIGENVHLGPNCVIDRFAVIEDGTVLKANVFVGQYSKIGKNCLLMPNVSIMDYSVLGNDVILHAGVVIGDDGFGYETVDGQHLKAPQIGNVLIGDSVEIGANSTIDRARFGHTVIEEGTKIDNLVQIGHNVKIGKHCAVVAQSGIAGSASVGDHVLIGGQVGIIGHVHVGDESMIGGQSGVNSDLPPKSFVRGSPAISYQKAQRIHILSQRLPEIVEKVKNLEKVLKND